MAGTPTRLVHRSRSTAASTSAASNDGPGSTTVAPWQKAARLLATRPKQWKRGTGTHTRSASL